MTTPTQTPKARPSWFTRFWALVRYEMLWNIRKKKFIGIVILAFVLATLFLALPVILSGVTGTTITANADYAIAFSAGGFGFFLFGLAIAMNSISSEFESGTIVPLLTKPISRTMVFLGKLFAAFILTVVIYAILFIYATVGSIVVYGPQNHLELVPLGFLGNIIGAFIWIAIILAVGALSKNTILTALAALGLFLGLFIALPIISTFAGPSQALAYVPGSGATGYFAVNNSILSVSTGPDNVGTNLISYVLYPSANVQFIKLDIATFQGGTVPPNLSQFGQLVYTEPMSTIALRSVGVAFVYIAVFLFIAWIALKRAQILE